MCDIQLAVSSPAGLWVCSSDMFLDIAAPIGNVNLFMNLSQHFCFSLFSKAVSNSNSIYC